MAELERVAVLHPKHRSVLTYGTHIGRHPNNGTIAVNCDDSTARYVHPINLRPLTSPCPPTPDTTHPTGEHRT